MPENNIKHEDSDTDNMKLSGGTDLTEEEKDEQDLHGDDEEDDEIYRFVVSLFQMVNKEIHPSKEVEQWTNFFAAVNAAWVLNSNGPEVEPEPAVYSERVKSPEISAVAGCAEKIYSKARSVSGPVQME